MKIFNYKKYHFLGIGGIGVSAIARMLFLQGKKVTGSDIGQSEITDDLGKLGIKVFIGQKAENLEKDTEVVIYSVAIKDDNPEILEAKKRGLLCLSYPQALGELSKEMFTIAVSGTHGKTTTTAMLGHILKKAGLDPTVIVGSKILGENTNFLAGKSKYLVVEACEYKRSFLNLHPSILTITNIEADHMDYYKNIEDIQNAFQEIADKVPASGFIIANPEEKNIKGVLKNTKAKTLNYDLVEIDKKIGVSGKHNILDAKAAIKTAAALGIDEKIALEYLEDFKGTWRRLEYKGKENNKENGNIFYDDYAHHPTEIKASLSALREKHPDKEIVCVFEPHQQCRTKLFFDDFVEAFSLADKVFVAPIFITREIDDHITTNKTLSNAINLSSANKETAAYPVENPEELKTLLQKINSPKPLCIVLMGAGNIYKWTSELIE
jgi:UDP-N-acetylmuramate--alanine ligase